MEYERDLRGIFSNVKVNDDIYDATIKAGIHCPRIHQLLITGTKGSDVDHRIVKAISTAVCGDTVLRFYSYNYFALDHMLA